MLLLATLSLLSYEKQILLRHIQPVAIIELVKVIGVLITIENIYPLKYFFEGSLFSCK